MSHIPATLQYLLMSWGVVTSVLMVLVIYGNTLSVREDGQLFLTKEEEVMMGSDQRLLVGKMHHLARVIAGSAVVSAILFVVSATVWVWIGLYGS